MLFRSVSVSCESDGDSFSLSFGGFATDDIYCDASASAVSVALERLPSTGSVSVSSDRAHEWVVTFDNLVGEAPSLTGSSADVVVAVEDVVVGTEPAFDGGSVGVNVLPLGSVVVEAVNEKQTISIGTAASDLRGSWHAWYKGEVTEAISYLASPEEVEAKLEGLYTIDDVAVTKTYTNQTTVPYLQHEGAQWVIEFLGGAGDVPSLLVSTYDNETRRGVTARGGDVRDGLSGTCAFVAVDETVKGYLPDRKSVV